jgi:agmatine/peptidylarginine deiminase
MSRFALLLALCALLVGCESSPAPPNGDSASVRAVTTLTADSPFSPMRTQGGFDYVYYPGEPMKHAYERSGLLGVGKADAADIRAAAPERYAITASPKGAYRAMVEWEPMRAVVMSYSSDTASYDGATNTAVQIGANAATVAEVWYLVDSQSAANLLTQGLQSAGLSASTINEKVRFVLQPLDSIWFIDSGPLPLVRTTDNTMAFADFRYYWNRPYDDGISTWLGRMLPQLGYENPADTYRMPLNTEGGTFQSTSDGICFTGTRQLYNMSCEAGSCDTSLDDWPFATGGAKTQQQYLDALEAIQNTPEAQEIKEIWAEYAGCKDVIITYSITDDGTGHIDMYLKVVDDTTVLLGNYEAPYDAPGTPSASTVLSCSNNNPCPSGYSCKSGLCSGSGVQARNALRMNATAQFMESYTKSNGQSFEVPRLVMPGHRSTNSGPIPFTYINSTFINGLNLWPATVYNDWVGSRNQAETKWEQVMPDYEHIWIDSTELSFWSGAIHCITRTIPDLEPGPWIADGSCSGETCQAPQGGYDSLCTPGQSAEPVCYGPQWLCGCNDCNQACPLPGEDPCDGISYTGCCDGKKLTYCDQGEIVSQSCQSCGWDGSNGWYDCGQSGGDPTGENPLSCDDITNPCSPSCGGKDCGPDGCGGLCGSCLGLENCDGTGQCVEPVCEPNCQGKQCGGDGCGATCGTCEQDQSCTAGVCVAAPEEGCGDISWEGTCTDGYMAYCNDGSLLEQNCDSGCCGWFPSEGYYWCYGEEYCGDFCVDECETGDYGCSEEGSHSWTCADPAGPGCRLREWSTCANGCDATAGVCEGLVCEPACGGKVCGADGCGGDCGVCGADDLCVAGQCAPPECVPDCENKACGDDGCGAQCGSCDPGFSCNTKGVCVDDSPVCEPACDGKDCGDDGCGGLCGACADGQSCNDKGQCIDSGCQPACEGKVCGDNGCGGVCGTCDGTDLCEAGTCVPSPCVGQCEGKVCGDDGCGASCGTCADGQLCSASGECEKVDGCGGLTYFGACDGSVVVWCEDNQVQSFDCASQDKTCEEKPGVGFTCVESEECVPTCDGRVCGDDGCGALCGTCVEGSTCESGQCIESDSTDPDSSGVEVTTLGGDAEDPQGTGEPSVQDDASGSDSAGCQSSGGASPWSILWLLALAWPLRRRR